MKIIIVLIFTIILFSGNTRAQAQYEWTDAQYHYQTGSIPPPYYYEYDIFINTSGTGTLVFHPSYVTDSSKSYENYTFTVSESGIKSLNKEIKKSKVLTSTFEELEKHPIGGSLQNAIILLYQDPATDHQPKRVTTPTFPASSKQKIALDKLYAKIKSFVPQKIWDDMESKKSK